MILSIGLKNLNDIKSPKFIYAHIMTTHLPFLFDKDGNAIDTYNRTDWNYYLGAYQYTLDQTLQVVASIQANADPDNPPIIIVQSDHGARNILETTGTKRGPLLENYPEDDKFAIINALYLPGYEGKPLKQDMNPISTFPLILNYYFGGDLPISGN